MMSKGLKMWAAVGAVSMAWSLTQADPLALPTGWEVHATNRPLPVVVAPPGLCPGTPPSDATVLFGGDGVKEWRREAWHDDADKNEAPRWKVENGYMEVVARTGSLFSRRKFGDSQIHIEWATPARIEGAGQGRGNSGIFFTGYPEVQVLDSFENPTYPDGSAAALYGMAPPLVNASRPPGEWQTYDIIFLTPRLDERGAVKQPARLTVFHNGILVHHAVPLPGRATEFALGLQDHLNPVRYRNIWVRPLRGYDWQPEAENARAANE
jgi:hypothetical protein